MFLIFYILAMVVPGAALTFVLRVTECKEAMSIALSLSVLVISLLLARIAGWGSVGFGTLLVSLYALIMATTALTWWLRSCAVPNVALANGVRDGFWLMPVVTLGLVAGYVYWAGPYMEVPSDSWWHMARFKEGLELIADGSIGSASSLPDIIDKKARYWHTLIAWFLHVTNTELESGLHHLSMANTLLFCTAVYSFALFVFRNIVEDRWLRHCIAATSVFFFVSHFGISVFSYLRYYIFAPTVLNYVVYLAAVVSIVTFITKTRNAGWYMAITVTLGTVATLLHTQEAVFIAVMLGAVTLSEVFRVSVLGPKDSAFQTYTAPNPVRWRLIMLFIVILVSYLFLHGWAYAELSRHDPLKHGTMASIRHYVPFLQNLYILRPEYQFYQVITIWGVFVYALFIFNAKHFLQSPYLVAGMAMPVLTVFNPIFSDFFLRFSWPEVLWRMCYMIPLPLVGGYFLVRSVAGFSRASGIVKKCGSFVTMLALITLLFPINSTYVISHYSKIYTLAPVDTNNDHRQWRDLLNFLKEKKATQVITDPVTGYVLNGLTKHEYSGHKFYGTGAMRVNKNRYTPAEFEDRLGGLVVINGRDGAISETGRYGRHWPADVLHVSTYYSPEFRRFVTSQPETFERVWEADRIAVYRIIDNAGVDLARKRIATDD